VEVIDDLGKCIATAITSYQKDFEELSNNDFMRIFCNQQVKQIYNIDLHLNYTGKNT
jgi:hypothetical protein